MGFFVSFGCLLAVTCDLVYVDFLQMSHGVEEGTQSASMNFLFFKTIFSFGTIKKIHTVII